MPEFKQYPTPMVFHQALISVIPKETGADLTFNFELQIIKLLKFHDEPICTVTYLSHYLIAKKTINK